MVLKGFEFAILLQLAVGPVCIFLFQTAINSGLVPSLTGVLGVALVDALYILLAIFGIGALITKNEGIKKRLAYFGAIIFILFGVSMILESIGISILPSLSLTTASNEKSIFIKTIILTLSNPLTIVFWAGVFSSKITQNDMRRSDMYLFGAGAILSTLFFLSLISIFGSIANSFLNDLVLKILNITVGIILIFFGSKAIIKTSRPLPE